MALDVSKNLNFIGALALYQHRRDTAIGLSHITTKQRGLLWYYNALLSQQLKDAAFYGAMQTIQKRMTEIMAEVENSGLDRQRELLLEAMNLKEQMEVWQRQISSM